MRIKAIAGARGDEDRLRNLRFLPRCDSCGFDGSIEFTET
jgi:hypothetical protein